MKELLEALIPFARRRPESPVPSGVPPKSIHRLGGAAVAVTRNGGTGKLLAVADCAAHLPEGFVGETVGLSNRRCGLIGPLSEQNAAALRRHFPWCAPRALPRDRVAVAAGPGETEALLRAAAAYRFAPVLARCPARGGERNDELDRALEAGMSIFTLDFSAAADPAADADAAFASLADAEKARIADSYFDRKFLVGGMCVELSAATVRRAAARYGHALEFALRACERLREKRGDGFETGIGFAGSPVPVPPEDHLYIARELRRRGVTSAAFAPGFGTEDPAGEHLARQIGIHAAIAGTFGGGRVALPAALAGSAAEIVSRLAESGLLLETAEGETAPEAYLKRRAVPPRF